LSINYYNASLFLFTVLRKWYYGALQIFLIIIKAWSSLLASVNHGGLWCHV